MKVTTSDLATMRLAIVKFDTSFNRSRYAAAGCSDTRYQWDLIRVSGLMPFVCDTLYKYCNDVHIATALRSLVRPLSEGS